MEFSYFRTKTNVYSSGRDGSKKDKGSKIFVDGITEDVTKGDLISHFQKFGNK